jgi:2-polyprenyl-3-methyl-5-hydroxy-6-metoxy-1,4-benzoquinol methylase
VDVLQHNREAWNGYVATGNRWTVPVGPEAIERARAGDWSIVLTPTRPVPRGWLGEVRGARILALASGGGQQGPVLAAAGGRVTVLDASPAQLAQDRRVAEREGLDLETVLTGLYEDGRADGGPIEQLLPCFLATRAVK